jgi:hypothetical protein
MPEAVTRWINASAQPLSTEGDTALDDVRPIVESLADARA